MEFLDSRICSSLSAIVAEILVPETLWWKPTTPSRLCDAFSEFKHVVCELAV